MESFVGQIITVGFAWAPEGWLACNGQKLPITQSAALYSLLSTTFGGDGQTTFGLPDLRGRTVLGIGQSGASGTTYSNGQTGGAETVTLTQTQLPLHTHGATFTGSGSFSAASQAQAESVAPSAGAVLGRAVDIAPNPTSKPAIYAPAGSTTDSALGGLNVAGTVVVQPTGGGGAVPTMGPYLALNQIICTNGIYPSRS